MPDVRITDDAMSIVDDPAIDIVVELIGGYGFAKDAVLKAIDAVTAEQVAAVARTALQGAPALAATGSLATIPRYDVLANMLR